MHVHMHIRMHVRMCITTLHVHTRIRTFHKTIKNHRENQCSSIIAIKKPQDG